MENNRNKHAGKFVTTGKKQYLELQHFKVSDTYSVKKESETYHMGTHANLVYVGDQDFETRVLKSDSPVVVDFWAAWCGPCRSIAPYYESLSDEYKGKLTFVKVDTDENPNTPSRLGIQGIPTFIIFKGGQEVGRVVGADRIRLKREIDRVVNN